MLVMFIEKDALLFSLLKYIEIIFTALTNIILANNIGAEEMGYSIPIFLFITYSNYLCLGVNQVITKYYYRYSGEEKDILLNVSFVFICMVSMITVILSYIVLEKHMLLSGLISCLIFFRTFCLSYFRLVRRMIAININSIIFAALFFLGTLLCVKNLRDYLLIWLISSLISGIIYIVMDRYFFFKRIKSLMKKINTIYLRMLLFEGVKLSSISILFTLLLTVDKFFINKYDMANSLKGSYQLADNICTGVYIILTTVAFYYYPVWLVRLRDDFDFRVKYFKYLNLYVFIIPIISFFIAILSYYISPVLFPEFNQLWILIFILFMYKQYVLIISFYSSYYIANDIERLFFVFIGILLMTIFMLNLMVFNLNLSFYIIPILSIMIFIIFILYHNLSLLKKC